MRDAFACLPERYRLKALAVLSVGTVMLLFVLWVQGKPLCTAAAPWGIFSYEFSWNQHRAQSILDSWQPIKDTAKHQLQIDFAFLVVYPLTLGLACSILAKSRLVASASIGLFLSWAVLFAIPLDALENFALLAMLTRNPSNILASLAAFCAGVKFFLICACLVYLALQGLIALVRRLRAA